LAARMDTVADRSGGALRMAGIAAEPLAAGESDETR
jgi:hypothetical protein